MENVDQETSTSASTNTLVTTDPWDINKWIIQLNKVLEDGELEDIRVWYRKILKQFPSSTLVWYSWMQYEWRMGNYEYLEGLFSEALRPCGDVRMWKLYLQYVLLCNPPSEGEGGGNDELGRRQVIGKAYELALSHIGLDLFSGSLYTDYISFIMSWSANTLYEQQVQMDQIRKVYNRALCTPLEGIENIWHAYDAYENGLNKMTAKKMLSDKSATYMAARLAAKELVVILETIDREAYALLPPEDALLAASRYANWTRWIKWERANPLNLPEKSPALLQRIQYSYKCALFVLRQYGELWFELARWQETTIGKKEDVEATLKQAIEVLPLDLLVNFAYGDFLEANNEVSTEDTSPSHPAISFYDELVSRFSAKVEEENEEMIKLNNNKASQVKKNDNINGRSIATTSVINDTPSANNLTLAMIQQMNCCRRIEGIASARAVFTKARKNLHVTHQLFVASAQMEYHCKRDVIVAGKIYELGMSRFASNASFILSYLTHLLAVNDEANARALFERSLLTVSSAEALELWKVYLDFNFRFGDRVAIKQLLTRFRETYTEQPISADISIFTRQYSYDDELSMGSERLWMILQSDSPPPLLNSSTISGREAMAKPFFIAESIWEFQKILPDPSSYTGPFIDPNTLVKALQIIKSITDTPTVPKPTKLTTTSSSSSFRTTKTRPSVAGRGVPDKRRKRNRLDDGDVRVEPKPVAPRADDLFAQRYRKQ